MQRGRFYKNYKIYLIAFAITIVCCGCGDKQGIPEEQKEVLTKYLNAADVVKTDIVTPGENSALSTIMAYYYDDVNELFNEGDTAVYGEVTGVEYYNVGDGLIWSRVYVNILESIKGNLSEGDTIVIIKLGGYDTVKSYIESFSETEVLYRHVAKAYADFTEKEKEKSFVETTDGTPLASTGDRSVYYLLEDTPFSTEDDKVYEVLGAYWGEFRQVNNGSFVRISTGMFSDMDVVEVSAVTDEMIKTARTYNYVELKDLILNPPATE